MAHLNSELAEQYLRQHARGTALSLGIDEEVAYDITVSEVTQATDVIEKVTTNRLKNFPQCYAVILAMWGYDYFQRSHWKHRTAHTHLFAGRADYANWVKTVLAKNVKTLRHYTNELANDYTTTS